MADALASGASGSNVVWVQVPSSVPKLKQSSKDGCFNFATETCSTQNSNYAVIAGFAPTNSEWCAVISEARSIVPSSAPKSKATILLDCRFCYLIQ